MIRGISGFALHHSIPRTDMHPFNHTKIPKYVYVYANILRIVRIRILLLCTGCLKKFVVYEKNVNYWFILKSKLLLNLNIEQHVT